MNFINSIKQFTNNKRLKDLECEYLKIYTRNIASALINSLIYYVNLGYFEIIKNYLMIDGFDATWFGFSNKKVLLISW